MLFTFNVCRWYFQQLIVALDFCHKKGIGHRDLKLDNLLLAPNPQNKDFHHLKLADFHFTEVQVQKAAIDWSDVYRAPEIFANRSNFPFNPKKADVWSCGVILCTMLTGTQPFPMQSNLPWHLIGKHQHQAMMGGCPPLPQHLTISPECHALLQQLLKPNPEDRISVEGILEDPWFRHGLEPGVLLMNEQWLQQAPRESQQSDEQIMNVFQEALARAQGERGGD
jgi:serine/threonine-protein kinase SRK2